MAIKACFRRMSVGQARSSHSLTTIDNTAYFFGGEIKPRQPVDSSVYSFSLKGGASQTGSLAVHASNGVGDVPAPRVGHVAANVDGNMLVFGGRGGTDMKALEEDGAVYSFSPRDGRWTALKPKTDFPEPRSYHSGAAGDGKLFIHGGCPASGRTADVWSFDVATRSWTRLPDAPNPPRGGPLFTYAAKRLWRYGGFDGKTELGGQLDWLRLDEAQGGKAAWQSAQYTAEQCPGPRSVAGLHAVNIDSVLHLVVLLGERDASKIGHEGAGSFWDDVWALPLTSNGEPASDQWQKCQLSGDSDEVPARGWFASSVDAASHIVLHGGLNASNEREEDGYIVSFSS